MHIEDIQSSIISVLRQGRQLYIISLSIVWGNLQPIDHDHFVLDSLTCIHARQPSNIQLQPSNSYSPATYSYSPATYCCKTCIWGVSFHY